MNNTLDSYFSRQSRARLVLYGLVLVALVWLVDYGTGPFLSASIFYLAPITFVTWWVGRKAGITLSAISTIAWLVTDIITNPVIPNPFIPYWNAAVRLGFFLIVTYGLSYLRQARQRQEELMAFVVHDLRSPLSSIIMGLDLLSGTPGVMEDEMVARLVQGGISSGRRMLILINSLLDLARLENGKMPMTMASVAVNDLVQQAAEQVYWMAQRSQVKLMVAEVDTAVAITADKELTNRLLVNLLSNAIKFSPENEAVRIEIAPNQDDVLITIHNDGPGIPPTWQKRVFNKFTQVEARKAGAATGSGLGLAFCKLAVEAQNGRIWLEPVATGTTVCFTLPLASTTG